MEVNGQNDEAVKRFCHSFSGYDYWGSSEVSNPIGLETKQELAQGHPARSFSLTRLRTYAFSAARRAHMSDDDLDYGTLGEVFAAIREKLVEGDASGETLADRMHLFNRVLCQELIGGCGSSRRRGSFPRPC